MAAEQPANRPNSGYLFPNKKTKETQPDYRGKATIDGKDWAVSGWTRQKDGEAMISLSYTDPAAIPRSGAPAAGSASPPAGSAPSGSGPSDLGDIFEGLPG